MEYRIFIVDDDRDDHFFLGSALREVIPGTLVKSFYDGIEVLEELTGTNEKPDLIFLDLNMGKFPGRPTLEIIKKDKDLAGIPVIIFSTSIDAEEKEKLLKLGASAFYSKPVCLNELRAIVIRVKEDFLPKLMAG
jgi:CheY-like chemotaxis protein